MHTRLSVTYQSLISQIAPLAGARTAASASEAAGPACSAQRRRQGPRTPLRRLACAAQHRQPALAADRRSGVGNQHGVIDRVARKLGVLAGQPSRTATAGRELRRRRSSRGRAASPLANFGLPQVSTRMSHVLSVARRGRGCGVWRHACLSFSCVVCAPSVSGCFPRRSPLHLREPLAPGEYQERCRHTSSPLLLPAVAPRTHNFFLARLRHALGLASLRVGLELKHAQGLGGVVPAPHCCATRRVLPLVKPHG